MNSKYIKTKYNRKLKAKFFSSFQVLHLVDSQAYKLKLLKQWTIHNIFHLFLLEKNITRKGWVNKKIVEKLKFETDGNSKEYKVEGICDSMVYARKLEAGDLSGLYYLVSWKSYLKDKNTWEITSAVQHLRKLVSSFYKNYPNKAIVNYLPKILPHQ